MKSTLRSFRAYERIAWSIQQVISHSNLYVLTFLAHAVQLAAWLRAPDAHDHDDASKIVTALLMTSF